MYLHFIDKQPMKIILKGCISGQKQTRLSKQAQ